MASEAQANKARKTHGNDLVRRGVHAIGVEPGEEYGHAGFVVVAHVEPDAKPDLPSSLPSGDKGGAKVPVVVRRSDRLVPE
jgi:hypothetical protein